MSLIGVASYTAACAGFGVLTVLLSTRWRDRFAGAMLVAAAAITALWGGTAAYLSAGSMESLRAVLAVEFLRDLAWCLFLLQLLARSGRGLRSLPRPLLVLAAGVFLAGLASQIAASVGSALQLMIVTPLLFAILGVVLVEQVFRNSTSEGRWAVKYLCLGIGGLFVYDFFLYANALLVRAIDPVFWSARGAANALSVPFIAIAAARNPVWSVEVAFSRRMVFHTAAVLAAGLYLLLMAAAGYYIRIYGGSWGGAVEIVFFFGAVALLVTLLFSGQLRARAKLFFNKHFFHYRYDYREEWLRFMRTIVVDEYGDDLRRRVIRAIAEIVDSPGGALWLREGASYAPAAFWNMPATDAHFQAAESLPAFLKSRAWIVDLNEYRSQPERYDGAAVPAWLVERGEAWLVIPLVHGEDLEGLLILQQPRAPKTINWEDRDLLKTVARQAASYLALMHVSEALADARQFEAFNRLSAFVVHDLKNVVAQLALVVRNAEKHKANPEFIDDALGTVENAAARMNRMLAQLRKSADPSQSGDQVIDLAAVLSEVIRRRHDRLPPPVLEVGSHCATVVADRERLVSVLEHLVRNAQEATPPDGRVDIVLRQEGEFAVIELRDTGCGMEESFVRERLFRPFDTTKGNAGMGIGAYQAREFIHSLRGALSVESRVGEGTAFRLRLPLVRAESGDVLALQQTGSG